jgi:hypothetical protein
MTGPRSLHLPAVAVTLAVAVAMVLAPVAGLTAVSGADESSVGPAAVPPTPGDSPRSVTSATGVGTRSAAERLSTDLREPVRTDRNTTAYLALVAELETRRFGTATFDVGGAIAADGGSTRSTYETTWLRSSFAAAGDNRTRRQRVVERSADRIEARIDALERRERRALERYNSGEISARTYLRELAAIDRAAGSLRESVSLLHTYSAAVGQPVSERRIAAQKVRLLPLEGPVRDRVHAAIRGDEPPTRVYIETSSQGIVLATIDRGAFTQQYLREAYVPSARNSGGIDRFERSDNRLRTARDRAAELYPWAFENRGPTSTGSFGGEPFLYSAGVYSVRVGHPHGTSRTYDLITFLDGGTRGVFREVQYKDLSAIPTVAAGSNTSSGVTLQVNRTRTGGPMLVTVTNATTGAPVEATVLANGERVGVTDIGGERWLVAPGPTATITAVSGERNVTTTVFSDGATTG